MRPLRKCLHRTCWSPGRSARSAEAHCLSIQHLAVTTATAQAGRYDALTSPRVSLVAQIGRDSLHGSGDFGPADITGRQAMIGLQATVPLYTGGMRSAQRHEAKALERQAEAELDGADQQVRQQTRAAWLSLTTAAARVQALERLRGSAGSRRDATRLGAEIGGRTALAICSAQRPTTNAPQPISNGHRATGSWRGCSLRLSRANWLRRTSRTLTVALDRRCRGRDEVWPLRAAV